MNIKKLTYGALVIAITVLFPQLFHFAGPQMGQTFLPMHLPVFVGGFVLGPVYGFAIGFLSPLLSSLSTGMPPLDRLPYMMLELAAYGLVCGMIYRFARNKIGLVSIYLSLIAAMIAGRLAFAISLFVAAELLGISSAGPAVVLIAIATGAAGIIIQILFIPPVIMLLERSGFLDKFTETRKQA